MKCPFTFPDGRRCDGYVDKIKLIDSNLMIQMNDDGDVETIGLDVQGHVQLFCSKNGDHSRSPGVPGQLKIEFEELPEDVRGQIEERLKT